jgi:hypothetical protein
MDRLDFVRTRLLPALLTAGGVTLLAAGLLTYTVPVAAEPVATPSPAPSVVSVATPAPLITLPPIGTKTPEPTPSADPNRVATRVRIAALGIDLPIVKGPAGYPYCDVAMYLTDTQVPSRLGQPGQGRATYIFGHARPGMFEPLLKTKAGKQRGNVVEVWTSDDMVFTYEITDVRRAQTSLNDAFAAKTEQLWLQTSEGPHGTVGKTQVVAMPLDSFPAASHADAHPKARPRNC